MIPVACVFPFEYKGITYNSCTADGNAGTKWCATSLLWDGSVYDYGDCGPGCDNEEKSGK